jgi:hypothetical protein
MDQPNPLEGVSKEDFEYIKNYNKRPENMPFELFKSLQRLIKKLNRKRKGQLVFSSDSDTKSGTGKTYRKNDITKNT